MVRTQISVIRLDLAQKMVFLTGPRQVGKTWLARQLAAEVPGALYLNHDRLEDRRMMEQTSWPLLTPFLIFDELHKMKDWKNWLKGIFDTRPDGQHILVTGSARLETFRQTGDSLAGRFFLHRILPFTLAELRQVQAPGVGPSADDLTLLLERGGFPEPFLAKSAVQARRWRQLYADSLIQEDVLDFEHIHDLRTMKTLFLMLRSRVGSPVSFAGIANDLRVSPTTIQKYVEILEALYVVFRVSPWSGNIARSILKEPKLYFYDTGLVDGNAGQRLENLVALSLLKHAWALTDQEGKVTSLCYLRTKEGKEVDFCLVGDQAVQLAIEVKHSDSAISPHLWYFCERYGFAGVQLVRDLRLPADKGRVQVRDATSWLSELKL